MIQPIIRIGTTFLKKICRIDLLKTVLVITIIANIHITSPYDLCISFSFSLFFPIHLFFLIASPTQFGQSSFFPFKKEGGIEGSRVENYVYSFKNLFNILLFLCVVVGAFCFFWILLQLSNMFDTVICKFRTPIFMNK